MNVSYCSCYEAFMVYLQVLCVCWLLRLHSYSSRSLLLQLLPPDQRKTTWGAVVAHCFLYPLTTHLPAEIAPGNRRLSKMKVGTQVNVFAALV